MMTTKNEVDLLGIPWYRYVPAALVAILLIWEPLFVATFPGLIYTSHLTTVFLFQGCIGRSTLTVFLFCLLEILIAGVLFNKTVVPAMFGVENWKTFDHLKRRKLVGFCVKIIVRASCFFQLAILVAPQVDFEKGLFGSFNIKESNMALETNRTAILCNEAGMTITDTVAMRAWIFSGCDIMAVMVWELAYIPEVPIEAWLHHLFVIIGICLGTDRHVMAKQENVQTFIDSFGFFLILGGAAAGLVECCVLKYHLNNKNPKLQAIWMKISILIQSIMVIVLFIAFPVVVVMKNLSRFGGVAGAYIAPILILVTIEGKMILVKTSIVKHAEKKAVDSLLNNNQNQSDDAQFNRKGKND